MNAQERRCIICKFTCQYPILKSQRREIVKSDKTNIWQIKATPYDIEYFTSTVK